MNATRIQPNDIDQIVYIPANGVKLEGALAIPAEATGVVLFAHGSGSSRHSPRNKLVAEVLHDAAIGTLLIDLLTTEEDAIYANRFDIDLLTWRLERVEFHGSNSRLRVNLCRTSVRPKYFYGHFRRITRHAAIAMPRAKLDVGAHFTRFSGLLER